MDLESLEWGLRDAMLGAGARHLEALLGEVGRGRRKEAALCGCGRRMESRGLRSRTIQTVFGDVTYSRSMFACPDCGASRFPGDEVLGIVGTDFSPGLRRLMARAGSRNTFREGAEDLRVYAGLTVSAKSVERVSEWTGEQVDRWEAEALFPPETPSPETQMYISYDGTGVSMTPQETAGRKGKGADGKAKTREAKLGCVFTQTTTDEEGRPVREDHSTTFVGAIETAEAFGQRIYREAVRRGIESAQRVVVIGDGAPWIWNLADLHFSGALQIVDLYHAREHAHALAGLLAPKDERARTALETRLRTWLDEGKIEELVEATRNRLPRSGPRRKAAKREIGYFTTHQERMRYAQFRAQGLFVGSGVVEAGCKTVVGQRLKQSGMEWTVAGANAIIALRCASLTSRIEEFYETMSA